MITIFSLIFVFFQQIIKLFKNTLESLTFSSIIVFDNKLMLPVEILRTVYRAMSEVGLLHKRRTPHGITKATTEIQDKENLIKRDFSSDEPLKKLLTDITEVPCLDGKLYISPFLDCYNVEIVALEMRNNMKATSKILF